MTDKKDIISYGEYQKLSEDEKQNYTTNWNSDGKSGTATRKGAKLPKVKPTIPVTEAKQVDPSTAQDKLDLRNVKFDEKDAAADAEAKGKTETTDKANQMSDSSKAKTDTTATGEFINSFQKEKETADKDVEDAQALLDRIRQTSARLSEEYDSYIFSKGATLAEKAKKSGKMIFFGVDYKGVRKELERTAKDLNVDLGDVAKSVGIEDISKETRPDKLAEVYGKFFDIVRARLAAAKARQREAQAKYTKAEEEAAKRKAESESAPKAQKVAESTRNQLTEVTAKEQEAQAKSDKDQKDYKTQESEKETEKDEIKDPLKKAEELEQPRAPADIRKFSNDLNRFVIQAYLNGDFGKKSSPNAIASMGFFILDKIGTALVNASEVARGMSPSAKSQWSNVVDKQTELLGNRLTAEWFLSLPKETQEALIRSGVLQGTSSKTIVETVDTGAVDRARQRDILETSKMSQEQKSVAQSNVNALLARKSELQTLINQLKSDQGWEVYTQAMNAVVGTAKGLNSLGITDNSSSSSNKGFSDTLSADVSTGNVTKAFVSGGISNNSSWNNSSAKALSKSNSLSQDALALSKFKTGESYANATREAKKAANEQLIKRLEGQIEIIDKCIDSWGKDLGL